MVELAHTVRDAVLTAAMYGRTAARIAVRQKPWTEDAAVGGPLFVVGAPRSGTTFLAGVLGAQPGLVDLGEVQPLKAAIPELAKLPELDAAAGIARVLDLTRLLALARRSRFVEQTPEVSFVVGSALRAYGDAHAVHIVRDGRDVAASLLERGWLSAGREGADDAHLRYGSHARFWVEPERIEEFARASDATRAGWAWRRYVESARSGGERVVEVRYEAMVADPEATAASLGERLGLDPTRLAATLSSAHSRSAGRWRRDLSAEQVADVEREAGPLLRELGYEPAQT